MFLDFRVGLKEWKGKRAENKKSGLDGKEGLVWGKKQNSQQQKINRTDDEQQQ